MASFIIAIIDVISVVILGYVLYFYIGSGEIEDTPTLKVFLRYAPFSIENLGPLAISIFFILKFLLVSLSTYFFSRQVFKISSDIGIALTKKIIGTDVNLKISIAEKINLISYNLNLLVTQLIVPFYQLLTEVVVISTIAILMIYLEARITFIGAAVIIILSLPIYFYSSKFLKILSKERSSAELGKVNEMSKIDGLKYLLNTLSIAPWLLSKMKNKNLEIIRIGSMELTLMNLPRHFYEMVFVVLLVIVVTNYNIESQSMALIGVMFVRVLPSLTRIQSLINSLKMSYASRINIDRVFKQNSAKFHDQLKQLDLNTSFDGIFDANIIWEKYVTSGRNNIKLNIHIESEDRIYITGPSGVGKSTFLNSIISLGLYIPDKVIFNNLTLDPLSQKWQTLFGIVPQKTYIYESTIKEQILLGREYNKDKFNYALRISGLDKIFSEEYIFEKNISPNSNNKLSVGQEQRIGLARALFSKPPILLLDEFTSALDSQSEKEIIQLLSKIDYPCSILAISHRDEFVRICNKVIHVSSENVLCKKIEL